MHPARCRYKKDGMEQRHFKKIGLLVLNDDRTKFLVCEKYSTDMTIDYIMPGGQIEQETELACIRREVKEELDCHVKQDSIKYIGEYEGPAAGGGTLYMKLYEGELTASPKPSQEIKTLHWIGAGDQTNLRVSEFIRTKVIPDITKRGILKA